jgi:hypothetical protein
VVEKLKLNHPASTPLSAELGTPPIPDNSGPEGSFLK